MRAPRHRFSDDVRAATRAMAARMVEEDAVAQSPDQLDDWISHAPQTREALARDGYGSAFTAEDLFPLLQAMTGRMEVTRPQEARPRTLSAAVLGLGVLVAGTLLGLFIWSLL